MPRFSKENPKPGPGRPPGCKNKNFLNASIWLELLWDDVQGMTAAERQPILKWATEQILAKVQVLPATPGDSVSNGLAAYQLMNGLAPNNPPLDPSANGGPHTNGS